MLRKNILSFLFLVNLLTSSFSNHYFARARLINRDYEHKKLASRSIDIKTPNERNHVIPVEEETFEEKYYFALSQVSPKYKIITIQNDTMNNTILFISSDTFRIDNPEQIYFYPETFREFYNFLFTDDQQLNLQADDIIYNISKHSNSDSFFHITILMKTPFDSTQNETNEYKMRGVWLSSTEYKTLLSLASQLLEDLGL